jgi:putative flippase GtrA
MRMNRDALSALIQEHGGSAPRYAVVGLSGYLLSILLFAAQISAGVSPYAAVPLGFVVNTVWNFTLNRLWSFPKSGQTLGSELRRFWVLAVATLVGNYVALYFLHDVAGLASVPSQALAIVLITPLGYLGQRYWAFGTA